jgi:hypothetical protein
MNYFNDLTKGFFPSRLRGPLFAIADAIKLQFGRINKTVAKRQDKLKPSNAVGGERKK